MERRHAGRVPTAPESRLVTTARGARAIVISCEHGGNRIPAEHRVAFGPYRAQLQTHRGFDLGALATARALSAALDAPLVAATVSRLLVDLNRSIGHPQLHGDAVRATPPAERAAIVARYHAPHRARVEALVRRGLQTHGRVLHIASHSFTPVLDGERRRCDVGLLYDPRRPEEAAFCARWKRALGSIAPALIVRRNYPYLGRGDGLAAWFRKRLPSGAYLGIELELNQRFVAATARRRRALREAIVTSLRMALADRRPDPDRTTQGNTS